MLYILNNRISISILLISGLIPRFFFLETVDLITNTKSSEEDFSEKSFVFDLGNTVDTRKGIRFIGQKFRIIPFLMSLD